MAPTLAGIPLAGLEGKPGVQPPVIVSTWDFGQEANKAALQVLENQGSALDAVESGVHVPENDATNQSVGYGGLPDREGIVTLDACIMDHQGKAGSVSGLENIRHPISVARRVMEKTPHVMLVGDGALQFALSEGFQKDPVRHQARRRGILEGRRRAELPLRRASRRGHQSRQLFRHRPVDPQRDQLRHH